VRLYVVLSSCGIVSSYRFFLCNKRDFSDPESDVPFAQVLYGNDAVMQSFYDSLTDDGILVMQLGESSTYRSASEMYTRSKNRATTTELLTRVGFQSIHAYEEVSSFVGSSASCVPHALVFLICASCFDAVTLRLPCTMDATCCFQILCHSCAVVCDCC